MKIFIVAGVLAIAMLLGDSRLHGVERPADAQQPEKISNTRFAVFAGGCFWCTESDFEKVPGVIDAISGYTGGHVKNPTYEETSSGTTGHVEAVKVLYDPRKVTYEQLLDWFWHHVNPTEAGGQFVDRGSQYRSVIFYADAHERQLAEASRERLAASGVFNKPIATDILPLGPFYPAEEYHQNYHTKNPIRYKFYRFNSGRDRFLEKTWNGKQDILVPKSPNHNEDQSG